MWSGKRCIFAGSEGGVRTAAVLFSLTASYRLHQVDPWKYLNDALGRINNHPVNRVAELTPAAWVGREGAGIDGGSGPRWRSIRASRPTSTRSSARSRGPRRRHGRRARRAWRFQRLHRDPDWRLDRVALQHWGVEGEDRVDRLSPSDCSRIIQEDRSGRHESLLFAWSLEQIRCIP